MENEHTKSLHCPEGLEFLKLASEQEDSCEKHSHTRLLQMGHKAPQCLENLGTVLSLLDRAASCFWGCHEGDHLIEYLAGRVAASARASLRLLYFGFYDESLSITRSIGEAANLLAEHSTEEGGEPSPTGPTGGSAARLTVVLTGGSPVGAMPHLAP